VLQSLEGSQYSAWIRDELWGWPLALTLHAFGTAVVVGFVLIITLRLLGLFETIPYAALNRLFPVVWVAVVLQLLSGFALWMAKPTRYVVDGAFLLKLSLIVVGIVLTSYASTALQREGASWQAAGAVSARGVKLVAAAVFVWCAVLVLGRMTAYLGSI
jgi:predicted ABC-type exoprotein transport system permease subunit